VGHVERNVVDDRESGSRDLKDEGNLHYLGQSLKGRERPFMPGRENQKEFSVAA